MPSTDAFHAEFKDLVNSSTFLVPKGYLVLPQANSDKIKILTILLLEAVDDRIHLLPELEENMSAEAFAKKRELFDERAIIAGQFYEDVNWD